MSRAIRLALSALVAAGLAAVASAQAPAPPALANEVDKIFSPFTPDGPGCAVAVYQNAKITLAKGYGSANLEYGVPISPTTPFIVGSVSKQFTAAAIALLIEEKRIALTDDVRKYVPELADYGTPITIDHLVHHTSGLRDWWELVGVAGLRHDDTYTVQDVLDMTARQHGLNFKPGERYLYSNTGYIVLGIVVQRVAGKSLREFAADRIFGPLMMADSHYQDDHTQPVRGRAYAYSPADGGRYTINVWNNDLVGQGGVMTTVLDLAKWDENFYSGAVGGPAFLLRQLERGKLNAGTQIAYLRPRSAATAAWIWSSTRAAPAAIARSCRDSRSSTPRLPCCATSVTRPPPRSRIAWRTTCCMIRSRHQSRRRTPRPPRPEPTGNGPVQQPPRCSCRPRRSLNWRAGTTQTSSMRSTRSH